MDGRHEESIAISDLWMATPRGRLALTERYVEIKPGDHVLITGEQEDERALFQAIAGLWPWGGGRIARPHRQSMVFMPTPGYAAPGTLRRLLAYPPFARQLRRRGVRDALAVVGLEHFAPMLDDNERWDRRLSDDEKQRLAMARVLLVRPRWLVLNRALANFDPQTARRLAAAFARDMPEVGVVYIGEPPEVSEFFHRTFSVVADPQGPRFKPSVEPHVDFSFVRREGQARAWS